MPALFPYIKKSYATVAHPLKPQNIHDSTGKLPFHFQQNFRFIETKHKGVCMCILEGVLWPTRK